MPQGILASGPRIMQAAMEQEPVRRQTGGYQGPATGLGMSGFTDFLNQYVLGPNMQVGGSPSTDESVSPPAASGAVVPKPTPKPQPAPGAGTSEFPDPDVPSTQPGDVNFGPELIGGAPYPQPGAVDSGTGGLKTPAPRTDDETETEGSSTTALMKMLKDLRNRRSGDDKSTKEYVEEANALLKEFGIDAPDLKGRKDLRIMEFFLNMAAGQSPDFLTNVAQAGKESFKGYGEDVREVEAAEQKLKLAGLEMGLAEKARTQAAEQAILLKELGIAADAFEKITDLPDKSQQIKILTETFNVPQEDAIKLVYPDKTVSPTAYAASRQAFIDQGHSAGMANYLAKFGASMITMLYQNPQFGEQLGNAVLAGGQDLTSTDKQVLGLPDNFGETFRAGQ
jgi:hypothetical protein